MHRSLTGLWWRTNARELEKQYVSHVLSQVRATVPGCRDPWDRQKNPVPKTQEPIRAYPEHMGHNAPFSGSLAPVRFLPGQQYTDFTASFLVLRIWSIFCRPWRAICNLCANCLPNRLDRRRRKAREPDREQGGVYGEKSLDYRDRPPKSRYDARETHDCPRCSASLVHERFYGMCAHIWVWRCIKCGEIIDDVVLYNRRMLKRLQGSRSTS